MKAICKNNKQKCIDENSFFSEVLPNLTLLAPATFLSPPPHNVENFTSAAQISSAAIYWPVDLLTTPPGVTKIWNHFYNRHCRSNSRVSLSSILSSFNRLEKILKQFQGNIGGRDKFSVWRLGVECCSWNTSTRRLGYYITWAGRLRAFHYFSEDLMGVESDCFHFYPPPPPPPSSKPPSSLTWALQCLPSWFCFSAFSQIICSS